MASDMNYGPFKVKKKRAGSKGRSDANSFGQVVHATTPPTTLNTTIASKRQPALVTECSTVWSVLSFGISCAYPATFVEFVRRSEAGYDMDNRLIYSTSYSLAVLPIALTGLVLQFALKPRKNDLGYKLFLKLQYFIFSVGSEMLYMTGCDWERSHVFISLARCLLWVAVFPVFAKIRSNIARLSDSDLSSFLSMSVVKGGLIVGLSQLAFLTTSSIQVRPERKAKAEDPTTVTLVLKINHCSVKTKPISKE